MTIVNNITNADLKQISDALHDRIELLSDVESPDYLTLVDLEETKTAKSVVDNKLADARDGVRLVYVWYVDFTNDGYSTFSISGILKIPSTESMLYAVKLLCKRRSVTFHNNTGDWGGLDLTGGTLAHENTEDSQTSNQWDE